MQDPSHKDTFTIHINEALDDYHHNTNHNNNSKILKFSTMKLFHRFRKILMRLMLTLPSSSGRRGCGGGGGRRKNGGGGSSSGGGERLEPPKISCSSYYSSHSHYSEAIADCIEFFNKSSAHESHDEDREEDHQVAHDHSYFYV